MIGLKFCGTGHYLPENRVDNDAYTSVVETSDEWIRTRTGIVTRPVADGDATWSMGAEAARQALENAGVGAEEIDLILVTTVTSDYITPSLSCVLQNVLGAKKSMCIDINCACAAFVYALDMARRYLACGDVKTVLVVSAEMLTRITNYEDRSTCVLFGDGAGACVLRAAENALFGSKVGADGSGYDLLFCKNVPQQTPFTHKEPPRNAISDNPTPLYKLYMGGREVYKFATRMMPEALKSACTSAGITPDQLDWIVPHQANIRIVQTAMKNLGLPMEKAWMSIDHCGNTSSASIPIALDELARSGKLHRGEKVGVVGFGGGLTYGGAVFEW